MEAGKRRQTAFAVPVALFAVLAVAGPIKMVTKDDGGGTGTGDRVGMAGRVFRPGVLTVKKGTTVTFENNDIAPHTVTGSGTGAAIQSGILQPGKSFVVKVDQSFPYSCEIHPSMTASVEVTP